jgi:hypothetical protein
MNLGQNLKAIVGTNKQNEIGDFFGI